MVQLFLRRARAFHFEEFIAPRIAQTADGVFRREARHDGIGVDRVDNRVLDDGENVAIVREKETGSDLHARRAHDERGRNGATVRDAARCDDRDFHFRDDIFHERHDRQFPVMPAGFHAFDDNGVRAFFLHALGEFHIRDDGDDFDAVRLERLDERKRIARADCDERHFFIDAKLGDVVLIRRLEHEIDAERFFRRVFHGTNLLANVIDLDAPRRKHARAARRADGGNERRIGDVSHRALDNRIVNVQKFCDFCVPHRRLLFEINDKK